MMDQSVGTLGGARETQERQPRAAQLGGSVFSGPRMNVFRAMVNVAALIRFGRKMWVSLRVPFSVGQSLPEFMVGKTAFNSVKLSSQKKRPLNLSFCEKE